MAAAAEAKRLQSGSKVSLKETLGALFSNKKEGEGMTEKIVFEKLPPALVIHLKRTQCTSHWKAAALLTRRTMCLCKSTW